MKVNGGVWREQTQCRHGDFGVVLIGGAIVHPRWWRLQPMKGNGCASPRRGPRRKQPSLSHHGHRPRRTCLTRVDLHEVGDLLARTNSWFNSTILTEAPKWHLTNLGDTTLQKVIDGVLMMNSLLLVLQMIVSPTLNSLSQIWLLWKDDLSGKQLGEG